MDTSQNSQHQPQDSSPNNSLYISLDLSSEQEQLPDPIDSLSIVNEDYYTQPSQALENLIIAPLQEQDQKLFDILNDSQFQEQEYMIEDLLFNNNNIVQEEYSISSKEVSHYIKVENNTQQDIVENKCSSSVKQVKQKNNNQPEHENMMQYNIKSEYDIQQQAQQQSQKKKKKKQQNTVNISNKPKPPQIKYKLFYLYLLEQLQIPPQKIQWTQILQLLKTGLKLYNTDNKYSVSPDSKIELGRLKEQYTKGLNNWQNIKKQESQKIKQFILKNLQKNTDSPDVCHSIEELMEKLEENNMVLSERSIFRFCKSKNILIKKLDRKHIQIQKKILLEIKENEEYLFIQLIDEDNYVL